MKRAALGAYALAVGAILVAFLGRYPLPEFVLKIAAVLSALWYAHALHACGRFLRTALKDEGTTAIGTWGNRLTNAAIGFGAVGSAVLLLGWAVPGDLAFKIRLLFGLLVAVSIADWSIHRGKSETLKSVLNWDAPAWLAALPAAGALISFLSSFSPITHYDSLVYHLALPAAYLREGAIGVIPFNLYSFFPALAEMNFLLILAVLPAPEYTINLAGWMLAAALGAAVAEWAREIGGAEQSWISSLIWWTAPLVLLVSQGAYVDFPLAAATFLSVRWYLLGRTNGDRNALLLAGFLAGLAFSIKYTGALTFIFLSADILLLTARRRMSRPAALGFVLAAAVCPAPWLLKNISAIGNPVFPFLYRFLGAESGWPAAAAQKYFGVLSEYGPTANALIDLVGGPLFGTAVPARGGFDILGDFGWPIVLLVAPLAFFLRSERRDIRLLSAYALAHFAAWYFSKPVMRFLISLFPIALVLASTAIRALLTDRRGAVRYVTLLLMVPWLVSNIFVYGLLAAELRLFAVPFGNVERDDYLRQRLAFYSTYEILGNRLGKGARVLLIGEQRTYHLTVPSLSANHVAPSPVAELCNTSPEPDQILKELRLRSVPVVLVNEAEIGRQGGLQKFGFTAEGEKAFRRFLSEATTVVSENRGIFLHRLKRNQGEDSGQNVRE